MASNIPTRRGTRTTRTTAAVKENESINPRPSRISTRSKLAAASLEAGPLVGMARTTAASRAKAAATAVADGKSDHAAGKRKREALGEVAVAGNKPRVAAVKGKEKENPKEGFDGVVLKSKSLVARQPLSTVATRQTGTTKITAVRKIKRPLKVDGPSQDDNAMVVDPPVQDPLPSITVRRSLTTLTREVQDNATSLRRLDGVRRVSARLAHSRQDIVDLEEERRVFKKRRTSSEPPQTESRPEEVPDALEDEEAAIAARIAAEMDAYADEPEADPETSAWDDLDADDADDPLMVSEYVVEIFKYMRQAELATMPNPNYMESQKELAWKMRGILTDWLVQVHVRFRLLPETLFLCVNIIDRFLSARVVSLAKLQLVGITCLFIAAKFEEIVAPGVNHFLSVADSSYTESEILQAERYVLKTLDWNLSFPNPVHYLRRVSKADDYNVAVRTLAKYLLEIVCLEWRLIAAPPSLIAAAAIWLARLAMGFEDWSPNLAHYSGYKESVLVPTANLMLNYILKPIKHEAFFKKYAGKRYSKASVYMREWATERWAEDTQVDLARELLRIKATIRLERDAEELRCQDSEDKDFNAEGETFVNHRLR